MTEVQAAPIAPEVGAVDLDAAPGRRWVLFWAPLGVAFVTLQTYLMVVWFASGDAHATPTGPTPVPTYMKVAVRGWEVGLLAAYVVLIYVVVVRPWRATRRVPPAGYFLLSLLGLFWAEAMYNYSAITFTYNSYFVNLGSWLDHVPGTGARRGNLLAVPLSWVAIHGLLIFGGALVFGAALKAIEARFPRIRGASLLACCFVIVMVFDVIFEAVVAMPLGLWSYPGAIKGLTLNYGHYYQFPWYEAPLTAMALTPFVYLRRSTDAAGHTFAERGVDRLPVGARAKAIVRVFALAGIANAAIVVCFLVPTHFFAVRSESHWPDDIAERSYLTDHICGPGTDVSCEGQPGEPQP